MYDDVGLCRLYSRSRPPRQVPRARVGPHQRASAAQPEAFRPALTDAARLLSSLKQLKTAALLAVSSSFRDRKRIVSASFEPFGAVFGPGCDPRALGAMAEVDSKMLDSSRNKLCRPL